MRDPPAHADPLRSRPRPLPPSSCTASHTFVSDRTQRLPSAHRSINKPPHRSQPRSKSLRRFPHIAHRKPASRLARHALRRTLQRTKHNGHNLAIIRRDVRVAHVHEVRKPFEPVGNDGDTRIAGSGLRQLRKRHRQLRVSAFESRKKLAYAMRKRQEQRLAERTLARRRGQEVLCHVVVLVDKLERGWRRGGGQGSHEVVLHRAGSEGQAGAAAVLRWRLGWVGGRHDGAVRRRRRRWSCCALR